MTNKMFKAMARHAVLACFAIACFLMLPSCGDGGEKFREYMAEGELTKAQERLIEMGSGSDSESCALQLIKAYLKLDMPDKAINVYENITSWHTDAYNMQWRGGEYEREVCRLLREYLVAHGQYEKAWNYYPLDYEDENYPGNAQNRLAYLSDVVAAMCAKGDQEEATRFVEDHLRWFAVYVDAGSGEFVESLKANFSSDAVRQKLMQQIDNSY